MIKVKVIKLSLEEEQDIITQHAQMKSPKEPISKILHANVNQSLLMLRQIKNLSKWTDIEDMVNYVNIINKFKTEDANDKDIVTYVELDKEEIELCIDTFDNAAETGNIAGFALEKLVQVYKEFKKQ